MSAALSGMAALPAHPFGLDNDLERALELCSEDLREFDGSLIVITGGTGFVGSWLLELLTWSADRLSTALRALVITRNPEAFRLRHPHLASHRIVELRRADVRKPIDLPGADFVVAGASASRASGDARSEADVVETQYKGGDLARRLLNNGSRVLFLSSGAAATGTDAYSWAKRRVERTLLSDSDSGSVVIARLFTFVGPYLPLDLAFAVGNFYRDTLEGRAITIKGDGRSIRSYLYAADLARWLWVMMLRGEPGSVYDVGGSEAVSILELAERISRLSSNPLCPHVEGRNVPSSAGERYVPAVEKAATLRLHAAWDLDAALVRTWKWLTGRPQLMQSGIAR